MSLAAVPAYLIARRLLRPRLALVVAVADGARAVDALHGHADDRERVLPAVPRRRARAPRATLERPTPARQLSLLVLCGLAFETRAQAVALVAAAATAPLLLARDRAAGAAAHAAAASRSLYGVLAAARRRSSCSGPRRAASRRCRCSAPTAPRRRAATRSAASCTTCSTTWPSSTSTSASCRSRRCSRSGSRRAAPSPAARAFAAASLALAAWLLLEVAAFASQSFVDADRGAERLLPRAARARSRCSASPRTASCPRGARVVLVAAARRRRASRLHPVHALHHDERGLGHASRCCPGGGCRITASRSRTSALRGARRRGSPPPRCSVPAAPVRARPPGARRARTSSRRASSSRTAATGSTARALGSRCSPGSTRRIPTGSTAPSAATRRSPSSGTGRDATYTIWENEFFNRSFGPVYAPTVQAPRTRCRRPPVTRRADGGLVAAGRRPHRRPVAQYAARRRLDRPRGPVVAPRPGVGLDALPRRRPDPRADATSRASTPTTPGRAGPSTTARSTAAAAGSPSTLGERPGALRPARP